MERLSIYVLLEKPNNINKFLLQIPAAIKNSECHTIRQQLLDGCSSFMCQKNVSSPLLLLSISESVDSVSTLVKFVT